MISPVPSGFVRKSESPGWAPFFGQTPLVDRAHDGEPVLRLCVADGVTAGEEAARRAHLRIRCGEDRREHLHRQLLREGRDREREQRRASIAKTSLSAFVAAIAP
jgi:hypothetical protein